MTAAAAAAKASAPQRYYLIRLMRKVTFSNCNTAFHRRLCRLLIAKPKCKHWSQFCIVLRIVKRLTEVVYHVSKIYKPQTV